MGRRKGRVRVLCFREKGGISMLSILFGGRGTVEDGRVVCWGDEELVEVARGGMCVGSR